MRRIGLVIGGCLGLLGALGWSAHRLVPAVPTQTFRDRHGQVIGTLHAAYDGFQIWTPLAEIPPAVVRRTLQAEDRFFSWHPGVNPVALLHAAADNLRHGRVVRGGSTITQQLAKLLIQERAGKVLPRTFGNKVRETVIALGLELTHSKAWILERYLNTAYYGHRAYGVAAAAEFYFGKRLAELSGEEVAKLVALPRRPGFSAVSPTTDDRRPTTTNGRHFIEYVAAGNLADGPVVHTTLDLPLQRRLESAVAARLAERAEADPKLSAAVVAIDVASGDLLAMVGSRDYFNAAIDGAVNAAVRPRQPGSTLKPFTYFAAMTRGLTPESVLADEPMSFPAEAEPAAVVYAPQNFDRRFHGDLTVRAALANSYNVPAVAVLNTVGLSFYHQLLQRFGFTSLTQPPPYYGLAVTLGAGEVTLLELTNAYAALARDGKFLPYRLISDDRLPKYAATSGQRPATSGAVEVIPNAAQYAQAITGILADPAARRKAFGYNETLEVEGVPVAVKTGTSYEHRDNWVVGYTSDVAVGVWVGHPDGSPMEGTTGATGAGPVWHACMESLVRGSVFEVRGSTSPHKTLHIEHRTSNTEQKTWFLTSPIPNTTYRLVPFLPREHQQIMAEVRMMHDEPVVLDWYLDNEWIERTTSPRARVALPPQTGHHRLRVEGADGTRRDIPFQIIQEASS